MHRPIGPCLAIFAGAVDRVYDPHTLFRKAFFGILAFFRQQAIVGAKVPDCVAQELVGGFVSCLAQRLALDQSRSADVQQDAAGSLGQACSELGIVEIARVVCHLSAPSARTICSAASTGDISTVLTVMSGPSGSSYGLSIPVKFLSLPSRAFL